MSVDAHYVYWQTPDNGIQDLQAQIVFTALPGEYIANDDGSSGYDIAGSWSVPSNWPADLAGQRSGSIYTDLIPVDELDKAVTDVDLGRFDASSSLPAANTATVTYSYYQVILERGDPSTVCTGSASNHS
jgi:hypothetical protein